MSYPDSNQHYLGSLASNLQPDLLKQHGAANSQPTLHWLNSLDLDMESEFTNAPDLLCLSHLRWDFVYQRPQHLLSRCVQERRVFFVEEPIFDHNEPYLSISRRDCGVWVLVPHLPQGLSPDEITVWQKQMLDEAMQECQIHNYMLWYYTPMALSFSDHLEPVAVIYDCMDELSAFHGAPPILREREQQLFQIADLVFTGGQSLYEVKRHQHDRVYAFPSSIDATHFALARHLDTDPPDQADIPHPRLGFFGVIDERFDLHLLENMAQMQPDWHFVIIGPVVKIDPTRLPLYSNIHYLGGKSYQELPHYVAGWDVALLPFARNESTRFISPTKTPEYLAAGKPVVSTSIRDVVRPYGEQGLVQIADVAEDFIAAAERAMQQGEAPGPWLAKVDSFLAQTSWNSTWEQMSDLIGNAIAQKAEITQPNHTASMTEEFATVSHAPVLADERSIL